MKSLAKHIQENFNTDNNSDVVIVEKLEDKEETVVENTVVENKEETAEE